MSVSFLFDTISLSREVLLKQKVGETITYLELGWAFLFSLGELILIWSILWLWENKSIKLFYYTQLAFFPYKKPLCDNEDYVTVPD